MPTKRIDATATSIVLGRHTRLGLTFKWRDPDGEVVDLTGYTARVWVSKDGNVLGAPRTATVEGSRAVYQMTAADLAEASTSQNAPVYFTCVAENGEVTLPPNKRSVVVGDWTGADTYSPAGS
jgi:hypothetical protein